MRRLKVLLTVLSIPCLVGILMMGCDGGGDNRDSGETTEQPNTSTTEETTEQTTEETTVTPPDEGSTGGLSMDEEHGATLLINLVRNDVWLTTQEAVLAETTTPGNYSVTVNPSGIPSSWSGNCRLSGRIRANVSWPQSGPRTIDYVLSLNVVYNASVGRASRPSFSSLSGTLAVSTVGPASDPDRLLRITGTAISADGLSLTISVDVDESAHTYRGIVNGRSYSFTW